MKEVSIAQDKIQNNRERLSKGMKKGVYSSKIESDTRDKGKKKMMRRVQKEKVRRKGRADSVK